MSIVGIFDLLGAFQFADATVHTRTKPNGMRTSIFFVFCFGVSRYSMYLEKSLIRALDLFLARLKHGSNNKKIRSDGWSSQWNMNKWFGQFHVLR